MEHMDDSIQSKLERVQAGITQAAHSAGRRVEEIHLLVVTKAQPVEKVQAAYQAGARLFGENYPEETLAKIEAMRELAGIEWHMIGHLQSRKARIVTEHFTMLHSLDSLSLAEKLERLLAENGRMLPVLLEVNASGEESKHGFSAWQEDRWDDLLPELEQILSFTHLRVRGLMTMPPLFADAEAVRPFFCRTRRLLEYLAGRFPQADWKELSMGTSADYCVAIEEGATYVRVGTAIMGPRSPKV